MPEITIYSGNDNFDAEGLENFTQRIGEYHSSTYSPIAEDIFNKQQSNYCVKLTLAGVLVVSCLTDTLASPYVTFHQSDSIENAINNYNSLVDDPLNKYIQEITGCLFNAKTSKENLVRRIVSFESLKQDWDGFGAVPLEVESAGNAINFLNQLKQKSVEQIEDIFPTPNGTVSMFWKNESNEMISFELGNRGYSYYVKFNSQEPKFYSGSEIKNSIVQELEKYIHSL